jgi:hypothetical protein
MGRQAEAQAEAVASSNKPVNMAMGMVDKLYDNWLQTEKANPLNAMGIDPIKARAEYDRLLQQVFRTYNIPMPAGVGPTSGDGGFKLMGSRPGP